MSHLRPALQLFIATFREAGWNQNHGSSVGGRGAVLDTADGISIWRTQRSCSSVRHVTGLRERPADLADSWLGLCPLPPQDSPNRAGRLPNPSNVRPRGVPL